MKLSIESWDQSYSNNKTPWREEKPDVDEIIAKSGIGSGTALDLGCGTGEWAKALAEKGFEVEGLDFSDEALKIAREQSGQVSFLKWDLEDLANYPAKHQKYDLILDQKVLAFIENKEKYLDTIKSRLGGVFVLTVFHEHDEKPAICVSKDEFEILIPSRFEIMHSDIVNPRPGKTFATYYLK